MEVLGGGATGYEVMIQEGQIVSCTGQPDDTRPGVQAPASDAASKNQAVKSQS